MQEENHEHTSIRNSTARVGRRTLVTGAAWTVPVIASAVSTPFAAASTCNEHGSFENSTRSTGNIARTVQIPGCVTKIDYALIGGGGGDAGGYAGSGAIIRGTITLVASPTPHVLEYWVGGRGQGRGTTGASASSGWSFGGAGGLRSGVRDGGDGGGSSAIRIGSTLLVVAGGGGGGANGSGSVTPTAAGTGGSGQLNAGGGTGGRIGNQTTSGGLGGGATGGVGGQVSSNGQSGQTGGNAPAGNGGVGGSNGQFAGGGGGGGGGYTGGGGGSAWRPDPVNNPGNTVGSGGGAGSSFIKGAATLPGAIGTYSATDSLPPLPVATVKLTW